MSLPTDRITERPTTPFERGVSDGRAVLSPDPAMARALDVDSYPRKSYELEFPKKMIIRKPFIEAADFPVKEDFSFMNTSNGASDYAKGYAEGVTGFLRDQKFPHLEDLQRMGFLRLHSSGVLAGFGEGLNWRDDSKSGSAKQDFYASMQREIGVRSGVVVALFKNHGIAIEPIKTPATERGLQVLRMGSQGKSFIPLPGDTLTLDVFKLQDVHRLGLSVWLKEMGIEDFDVMQIVGTNLDPFKLGLEGRAEDDPEVLKLVEVFPKIDVQALLDSLGSIPVRKPRASDYEFKVRYPRDSRIYEFDREIFPKAIKEEINFPEPDYGSAYGKPDRFHEVPLSTLFAEKPSVSRMQAYKLGVQAKAQIDASKNSGSSNS